MHPLDSVAGLATWAANNTAYNLDFIPADKLDWKPGPEASSALEIVNHVCGFISAVVPLLQGGQWSSGTMQPATDAASARQLLQGCGEQLAAALTAVPPEKLGEKVPVPFGEFPLGQLGTMAVCDLIHHHGQIAYIQTLLGDTESHFLGM